MHSRKLVKSGLSSLVVALPKGWIEDHKLKPGDEVYIEGEGDVIHINADFKKASPEKNERIINIDGKTDRIISREINSAYMDNYYYISLRGSELKKRTKQVKSMISAIIALEVVDESSDRIVAKSFLDIYDSDIKLVIRRMDNIIRNMMSDTKQAVTDPDLARAIVDRDIEINKLNLLVSKILKTAYKDKNLLPNIGLTSIELLRYWELNGSLEKIADRVKHIAALTPKLRPKNRSEFIALFTKLESTYHDVMKAFYLFSLEMSDDLANKRADLLEEINEYAQGSSAVSAKIAISEFNLMTNINDIGRIIRYLD